MSVKLRWIRNKWYMVVHYRGERRAYAIGTDLEEAEEAAKQMEREIKLHGIKALRRPKRATFEKFADKWAKDLPGTDLKQSTRERYASSYRIHLRGYFAGPLDTVSYTRIKEFIRDQAAQGLSKRSIRNNLQALRLILQEAEEEGLIEVNPAGNKKLSRFYRETKVKEPIQPFDGEELATIEAKTLEFFPRWYPLLMLLSRTGMRMGEARALKWEDISFKRGQIHVCRNHPAGRKVTRVKTRSADRYIEMTEDLAAALRRWKKDLRAEFLKKKKNRIPDLVYVNGEGNPFDYSNFLNRYWNRALLKAQVDERNPHQLRHTFASRLIAAGVPLTRVAYLLGHSSPRVTLDYYAHFIPAEAGADLSGILDASKTQTKRKRQKSR